MTEARLEIYTGNRLERLLDRLAAHLAAAPLAPYLSEIIVVQSQGMRRWLTLGLAERLGIAAGLSMPFPGTFCRSLAERLGSAAATMPAHAWHEESEDWPYQRELLAWRIFSLLGGEQLGNEFATVRSYLAGDQDQRLRYQLATRLAGRFDDYQLFRPDLLAAWERGAQPIESTRHRDPARWQASLWREIVATAGDDHLGNRFHRLIERLRSQRSTPDGLPERISVFGVSSLPPVFLDLLDALSRFVAVRLYFVSPTREFWSDVRSARERARTARAAGAEEGNRLLATLGRQGREIFALLQRIDADGSAWHDHDFETPTNAESTVLAAIQADVLHLTQRDIDDAHRKLPMPAGDRSLQVHVCHSLRREIEVLRDAILEAFDDDPALRPHDVFVAMPDVSSYLPYIEAVFGVEHAGEPHLPFTVADRVALETQPTARAALEILEVASGRVTATDVIDLLAVDAVARAAKLDRRDLRLVQRWIRETGIRWGMDAEHREREIGAEAGDGNTWRHGLDRLLLGYATGPVDHVVGGIVPYAGATTADPSLLGRFLRFVETLLGSLRALRDPRTPSRWTDDATTALDSLLQPDGEEDERALLLVREALQTLRRAEAVGLVEEEIDLAVVREHVRNCLAGDAVSGGFLGGGVTFCSLKPMRTIPARVMCIAGLNEGNFPRTDRPASFDLMAAEHRPGDRSVRDDDRYLFLESVLAARQRLILSYVGKSQNDDAALAPSPVLSDLLEQIDSTFHCGDESAARFHLITEHRLQPFSTQYFARTSEADGGDARRRPGPSFSYSQENYRAALATRHEQPTPFIVAGQRLPAAQTTISLGDLEAFWRSPAKYFCKRVLQLTLSEQEDDIAEAEPFEVSALVQYSIRQRMLEARLRGSVDADHELGVLAREGSLPLFGFARPAYEHMREEVDTLVAGLRNAIGLREDQDAVLAARDPVQVEIAAEGWRLQGTIDSIWSNAGLVHVRAGRLRPSDRLAAWIAHLALQTVVPGASLVVGLDRIVRFPRITEPQRVLADLVAGYRRGSESPLVFFEQASHAYAEHRHTKPDGDPEAAFAAARSVWTAGGRYGGRSDCDDVYVALCVRDRAPLDDERDEFASWARAIWQPVLDAATEEEL